MRRWSAGRRWLATAATRSRQLQQGVGCAPTVPRVNFAAGVPHSEVASGWDLAPPVSTRRVGCVLPGTARQPRQLGHSIMGQAQSRVAHAAHSAVRAHARPSLMGCQAPVFGPAAWSQSAEAAAAGLFAQDLGASHRTVLEAFKRASTNAHAHSSAKAYASAIAFIFAAALCGPAVALCEEDETPEFLNFEPSPSSIPSESEEESKSDSSSGFFDEDVLKQAGLPNPGTLQEFKNGARLGLMPFDGLVCELTKSFAGDEDQLQIAQNITLGAADVQSGGGTYYHLVSTLVHGPYMFQGVRSPGAHYLTAAGKYWDDKADFRIDGQMVPANPQVSSLTAFTAFRGPDFGSEITLGRGGAAGHTVGFTYLQSVTNDLALGGELTYRAATGEGVQTAVVGKYSVEGGHTFYNTWHVDAGMLESAYVRAVGTKLKLYTEMKLKLDSTDPTSEIMAGYEYLLRTEIGPPNPHTGAPDQIPYTTLRGKFDSHGKIIVGLEQLTLGGQARLKLCAAMNHSARDYRFGFGMEVNH